MMTRGVQAKLLPLAAGWLIFISAIIPCGGGCGSSDSAGGGISGTGAGVVTYGEITGFGSVIVNGITFDMSGAGVMLDDDPGDETQLRIGMMVRVEGEFDANDITRGRAHRVYYMKDLEGPVSDIDYTNKTFVALGQAVVVSARTHFEHVSRLDQLNVGNIVEVSGIMDVNGNIQATFVELKKPSFVPGDDEIEIKGTIGNLNPNDRTFVLKGLIVDYRNALLEDVPNGILADGMFVEVKSRQGIVGGRLIASEVELESKPWVFPDDGTHGSNVLGPVRIHDDLEIPYDTIATLNGTTLDGNVYVRSGAQLSAKGAYITGNVQAYGALLVDLKQQTFVGGNVEGEHTRSVLVREGTHVGGNVQITEASSPVDVDMLLVDGARVDGNVQVDESAGRVRVVNNQSQIGANVQIEENTTGPYEITNNRIYGDLQFFTNRGQGTITGNDVHGNLQSKENSPRPTIENNIVEGSLEVE